MSSDQRRRRLRRRFDGSDAVAVRFRGGGLEGRGFIHNLSEEGMYLQVDRLLPARTELRIAIDTPQGKVEVGGRVIWTTEERALARDAQPVGFGVVVEATGPEYVDFFAETVE